MQLRGRKWVAFESDTWGFDTWGGKGPKNLCVDPDSHPETRPELAKLHNRVLISEKTFLEHTLRRLCQLFSKESWPHHVAEFQSPNAEVLGA